MITKLEQLFECIKNVKTQVITVAAAEDEEVLLAVKEACEKNIVIPILIGDEAKIKSIAKEIAFNIDNVEVISTSSLEESAEVAVKLVSSGKADFVMKGLLDTSILLKAVLNKEWGLRTDSLLSHVMVYELPKYHKLLVSTDGGMNIAPNYDQKVKIVKNAVQATKALGIDTIKIAAIAAKEKVNPKMQATVDARALQEACENGEFGNDVILEGPLAFDLAVSKEACEIKKFETRVGGDTDIMLVPTIEVGNGIGKSFALMADGKSAGVIMGAKAPIVLVSRADTHESKLYSIAYGALIASNNK